MTNPTLPNADELEVVAGKWLLLKRGLYWRPNSQGYTGLKSEAGRYTDEEVAIYRRQDEREVFILDAETADEIAPKCWPDVAQRHLAGLLSSAQAQIERLTRERDDYLRRAEEQFTGWIREEVARKAAEAEVKRLREALEYAEKGLDMVHNGLMAPSRPRQAVGEVCFHFLDRARSALSGGTSNG
jgi:hypothetical protein